MVAVDVVMARLQGMSFLAPEQRMALEDLASGLGELVSFQGPLAEGALATFDKTDACLCGRFCGSVPKCKRVFRRPRRF